MNDWNVRFLGFSRNGISGVYEYDFKCKDADIKEEKIETGNEVEINLYRFVKHLQLKTGDILSEHTIKDIIDHLNSKPFDDLNINVAVISFDYNYYREDITSTRYMKNYK